MIRWRMKLEGREAIDRSTKSKKKRIFEKEMRNSKETVQSKVVEGDDRIGIHVSREWAVSKRVRKVVALRVPVIGSEDRGSLAMVQS